jgi:hypothetical protein
VLFASYACILPLRGLKDPLYTSLQKNLLGFEKRVYRLKDLMSLSYLKDLISLSCLTAIQKCLKESKSLSYTTVISFKELKRRVYLNIIG